MFLLDQPKNVKCVPQIKILGWFLNERLSYDSTVNLNTGIVQKSINQLQPISRLLTVKQKTTVANSQLIPKITYGSALMIGQDDKVIKSIYRSQMSVSRWCRGGFCFMESVKSISESLKWDTPEQTIFKSTASLITNIIRDRKPEQILEYVRLPMFRQNANIGKNFSINTKPARKHFLNHGVNIYNILPDVLKNQNKKEFKKNIKKYTINYKPD